MQGKRDLANFEFPINDLEFLFFHFRQKTQSLDYLQLWVQTEKNQKNVKILRENRFWKFISIQCSFHEKTYIQILHKSAYD